MPSASCKATRHVVHKIKQASRLNSSRETPGQPSPRTAQLRKYFSDRKLKIARRCQPIAPKRYLCGFIRKPVLSVKIHLPLCVREVLLAPADGWMEHRTRPASVFPRLLTRKL